MARIGEIRGTRSFRRTTGRKPPREIILIVCEGETEQEYFKAARVRYELTNAEVIIADNTTGSAPINVVNYAERKSKEHGGYDQIYCVFDCDGHESFGRARDKVRALAARRNRPLPINEAVSIPCFEIWVLLHYEQTDAPFNKCSDVVQRIRRNHIANYEKADAGSARQIIERINNAVQNAIWLEGRASNNQSNPYTSVHQVLQHFERMANQPARRQP